MFALAYLEEEIKHLNEPKYRKGDRVYGSSLQTRFITHVDPTRCPPQYLLDNSPIYFSEHELVPCHVPLEKDCSFAIERTMRTSASATRSSPPGRSALSGLPSGCEPDDVSFSSSSDEDAVMIARGLVELTKTYAIRHDLLLREHARTVEQAEELIRRYRIKWQDRSRWWQKLCFFSCTISIISLILFTYEASSHPQAPVRSLGSGRQVVSRDNLPFLRKPWCKIDLLLPQAKFRTSTVKTTVASRLRTDK